jgi:hypothetical protein
MNSTTSKKATGFGPSSTTRLPEVVRITKPCDARPERNEESLFLPTRATRVESPPTPRRELPLLTQQELARRSERLERLTAQANGYTVEALRSTMDKVLDYGDDGLNSLYDLLHQGEASLYTKQRWLKEQKASIEKEHAECLKSLEGEVTNTYREHLQKGVSGCEKKLRIVRKHSALIRACLSYDKEPTAAYLELVRDQLNDFQKVLSEKKQAISDLTRTQSLLLASEQEAAGLRAQLAEYRTVGLVVPDLPPSLGAAKVASGPRPIKELIEEICRDGQEACVASWSGYDIAAFSAHLQECIAYRREEFMEQERADAAALEALRGDLWGLLGDAYSVGIFYPA